MHYSLILLGVSSALMGREAAMACTQAVETVITQHYNDQLRQLHALPHSPDVEQLIKTVKKYRDEEQVSIFHNQIHFFYYWAKRLLFLISRITMSPSKMAPTVRLSTHFLPVSFAQGAVRPSK